MNRKILILAFIGLSSTFKQTIATNEPNVSTSKDPVRRDVINENAEELIAKAESWFNSDSDLEDYDIYHQVVDRVSAITKYVHKRYPNIIYQRNQTDSMEKVVILHPGESGIKDNQTLIVFRQTPSHPKHYTGHLAYIRKLRGQVSVEWDILKSNIDEPQEVFAAAFTPYTYRINSIVRSPKGVHQAEQMKPRRRRKREKPETTTHKPKKVATPKNSKGGIVKKLKSKILEEALKRPSTNSEEEPKTEKPNTEKPSVGSLRNEISSYIRRKPVMLVPILHMRGQSNSEEEIPASAEEDSYIPTNVDLTTRRPSIESMFRFRRFLSPSYYAYVVRIRRSASNEETESALIQTENINRDPKQVVHAETNNLEQSQGNSIQSQRNFDDQVNQEHENANSDGNNFQNEKAVTQDKIPIDMMPNDIHMDNVITGNESLKISTPPMRRPVMIPNKIFDDSQENSASIELSIEDTTESKISRDGRKTFKIGYFNKRKPKGRSLQPLGSFFGGVDLNDTVAEERLPSNLDNGQPQKEDSKMIVGYDVKTNHPEFEDKSSPFTGILDCDYENVTLSSGEFFKFTSDMKSQLVRFLLQTLRGQCLSQLRENTLSLFLEDLVTLGTDMKVNLNTLNSIFKKKTLSKSQWDKVISAIYFIIYTDAYRHHAELLHDGQTYSRSPDAIKISLSVRTLTTMIIRGVEMIHDMEAHAVKISKSLITTINERYLHSLNEAKLLKSQCRDCSDEEDTNYQDRIQLRALKEFVIFGIDDNFGKKGSEMDHAFVEFYEKRLTRLTG